MTDFVVSKVVMSVCALLVAGVMTSVVETAFEEDPGGDIGRLLIRFQETVSLLAGHGGECSVTWTVPALPSGTAVRMSFGDGMVMVTADGVSRAADMRPELHTWTWDGRTLNLTAIEELDSSSPGLEAWTSHSLELRTLVLPVEDSPMTLAFVS